MSLLLNACVCVYFLWYLFVRCHYIHNMSLCYLLFCYLFREHCLFLSSRYRFIVYAPFVRVRSGLIVLSWILFVIFARFHARCFSCCIRLFCPHACQFVCQKNYALGLFNFNIEKICISDMLIKWTIIREEIFEFHIFIWVTQQWLASTEAEGFGHAYCIKHV